MAEAKDKLLLVRWEHHQAELLSRLCGYFAEDAFADVTLWCPGRRFKAHRVLLAACSEYFERLLLEQWRDGGGGGAEPAAMLLHGVDPEDAAALLRLMYRGETRVAASRLPGLLGSARHLGLRLLRGAGLRVCRDRAGDDAGQRQPAPEQRLEIKSPPDSEYLSAKKMDGIPVPVMAWYRPYLTGNVTDAPEMVQTGSNDQSPSAESIAQYTYGELNRLVGAEGPPRGSVRHEARLACSTGGRVAGQQRAPSPAAPPLPQPAGADQGAPPAPQPQAATAGGCEESAGLDCQRQKHSRRGKGDRLYLCAQCGKQFRQQRNFRYHLSRHSGSGEFGAECPDCGKRLRDRSYLPSHARIHRDRREFACAECGRRFNQRAGLRAHGRVHSGHRPHRCGLCGRAFSRRAQLRQHARVHTGERPFSCQVCDKQFSDRSNMLVHARTHLGIKPYTCDHCGRSFSRKANLQTHVVAHLPKTEPPAAQSSPSATSMPQPQRHRTQPPAARFTSVITRCAKGTSL